MDTVFSTQRVNGPYLAAISICACSLYSTWSVKYCSDLVNVFVQLCSSFNGSIDVHFKWKVIDCVCPCASVRSFN